VTIGVGEVDDTLSFEIAAEALGADFDRLRDRVEALGGSLAIESAPGGIRLSGSLPLRK
jgi:signal transduction histidine kinase